MDIQRDPVIGREVDGYRIESILGRGGMAVVYKGEDIALSRPVAIKRVNPGMMHDESFLRRFRSEAQALARLDSPHITGIYALRQTELGLLIIMEYVEGETLETYLQRGAMSPRMAVPILAQILRALEDAHEAGLIHRDIKPSNILITRELKIKVTDFGVAKALQRNPQATVTMGIIGTLNYMSPEQVEGRSVGPQSDIFSLGLTAYRMLSGELPFDLGGSELAKMRAIVDKPFPSLAQIQAEVPGALSKVISKALKKDPARRYESARAMRNALAGIKIPHDENLALTSERDAETLFRRTSASVAHRTHRPVKAVLLSVLVLALIGSGWLIARNWMTLQGKLVVATSLPEWFAVSASPDQPGQRAAVGLSGISKNTAPGIATSDPATINNNQSPRKIASATPGSPLLASTDTTQSNELGDRATGLNAAAKEDNKKNSSSATSVMPEKQLPETTATTSQNSSLASNGGAIQRDKPDNHVVESDTTTSHNSAESTRVEAARKQTKQASRTIARSSQHLSTDAAADDIPLNEPDKRLAEPDGVAEKATAKANQTKVATKQESQQSDRPTASPPQDIRQPATETDIPATSGEEQIRTAMLTPPEPIDSSSGSGIVFRRMMVDQAPRLIGRLRPMYPIEARRNGIEGRVILQFVVNENGRVQDVNVLMSPGSLLSDAAIDALQAARFKPGRINGNPVKVSMSKTLAFNLN